MRRAVVVVLGLLAIAQLSSCTTVWAEVIGDKVTDDILALASYRGRLIERGLVPFDPEEKVVRKVLYQRPWKVRAEVLEPELRKGDLIIYDGETMIFWWPNELIGVRIRGLKSPGREAVREHIQSETYKALQAYAFSLEGRFKWAGQRTNRWRIIPTSEDPYRFNHVSWLHEVYSIPMKMDLFDSPGSLWYGMEFEQIEFSVPVAKDAFAFSFPPNAMVFEWDVSQPGITLAEARRTMNFDVRQPKHLPDGHSVQKIVRGKHDLPMVAFMMNKGATWISLTQNRHLGGTFQLYLGKQIPLGDTVGYLNFVGAYSVLSWVKGHTQLTLIGNVAFPELIKIARSVE